MLAGQLFWRGKDILLYQSINFDVIYYQSLLEFLVIS